MKQMHPSLKPLMVSSLVVAAFVIADPSACAITQRSACRHSFDPFSNLSQTGSPADIRSEEYGSIRCKSYHSASC